MFMKIDFFLSLVSQDFLLFDQPGSLSFPLFFTLHSFILKQNFHSFQFQTGYLGKVCRKTPKRRYFALLSDVLVYGSVVVAGSTAAKRKFAQQNILRIDSMTVTSLPDDPELRNGFEIATPQKSFHVFASSLKEKDESLEEFSKIGRLSGSAAASGGGGGGGITQCDTSVSGK